MHRGFFLPVKAFPPAPNGPGTGGGRCHATYLCGERFNSRPPRGERPTNSDLRESGQIISIHALREEGDPLVPDFDIGADRFQSTPSARRATAHDLRHRGHDADFNPRPPRGERRMMFSPTRPLRRFQSTPSARRATVAVVAAVLANLDFNPRPPRGERQLGGVFPNDFQQISIHALREESDCTISSLALSAGLFQSTPSARRATLLAC